MAELIALLLYISTITPAPIQVTATGYTCSPHPHNAMSNTPGMCIRTYTGTDPHQPGVACPENYLGRRFYIPGYGILRCDDVPYHRTHSGLPHFDIRIVGANGYERAMAVSIGPMTIYLLPLPQGQERKGISHATGTYAGISLGITRSGLLNRRRSLLA